MSELEQLLEQKKALEEKIRRLQNNEQVFGTVRISKQVSRGGHWKTQALVKTMSDYRKDEQWMVIVRERTKEETAHRIRVLITDLSELLASIEKEAEK